MRLWMLFFKPHVSSVLSWEHEVLRLKGIYAVTLTSHSAPESDGVLFPRASIFQPQFELGFLLWRSLI